MINLFHFSSDFIVGCNSLLRNERLTYCHKILKIVFLSVIYSIYLRSGRGLYKPGNVGISERRGAQVAEQSDSVMDTE